MNDTSLLCARLRANGDVSTTAFNLNKPTQLNLFVIIDPPPSNSTSIDITINFNQSSDSPSMINEIYLTLLVPQSNFTINNETTTSYSPSSIPTFRWQNFTANTYQLIDLFQLGHDAYTTEKSLCDWNLDRWNRLLNGNMSNNVSYVYFLKTQDPQLVFTLIGTLSSKLSSPSPYLTILYCIPYQLGAVEIVLICCCCVLFVVLVIILFILHYFRGSERDRSPHLERYHLRESHDRYIRNHTKEIRQPGSDSISSIQPDDQKSNQNALIM